MKLSCKISVENRLLPNSTVSTNRKHVKSTLALCKNPKSSNYSMILFSSQSKAGTKYKIKNISKVFTRFMKEGKSTIQFKEPPHDLYIQADAVLLKSFLHLLKRVLENKIAEQELTCSSMSVTPTPVKPVPKILKIQKRSDYPVRGFPRTLEILCINNIRRCSLDRGILQLTKLTLLDLSCNCIKHLPVELNNLPSLKELNMSNNELGKSTLKQWNWMGGKLSKTLKLLNLRNNNLSYLPDQLVKLFQLITLHVDDNQLETFPVGIGNLKYLRFVTASNNRISSLPASAGRIYLQELDITNNGFDYSEQPFPTGPLTLPDPLAVCALKEYAARTVLRSQLEYSPEILPTALIDYLDYAKYCICGNACFNIYIRQLHMICLSSLGRSVYLDNFAYVPLDAYFCSLKCYISVNYYRLRRQPVT